MTDETFYTKYIKILDFFCKYDTIMQTHVYRNNFRTYKDVRYMNNATRTMINTLTQDILDSYDIQIPIQNIDDIVVSLGGSVQTGHSFTDGSVTKEGDSFKISLSPFQNEKRRRFTIAHELGHLFLHMGYLTNEELWKRQDDHTYHRSGISVSEREYQANEFAAAFLMPEKAYLKKLNDCLIEGNKVNTTKIAEYFNVSVEAASNRGKFLGYLKW